MIIAGRGAVQADAKDAIEAFAQRVGGLFATSYRGIGYFSGHPYSIEFVGTWGTPLSNSYLIESDLVFAVGCSLNQHMTDWGRLVDEATIVHVDTDPAAINRHIPVDLGLVGDAEATVEALTEEIERR